MGRLANYMTTQELDGAFQVTGMHGCRCKGMGEVSCGGECGETLWDDPDRTVPQMNASVGDPATPLVNTNPGNDAGPENNDWATEGMGNLGGSMTLGDYLTAQQLTRSERIGGMGHMGNVVTDLFNTIKSNPLYLAAAVGGLWLARKPIQKTWKKITG